MALVCSHGKDTVIKIDNSSDVLTDISQYTTSASMGRPRDNADTTTMGKSWSTMIGGVPGGGELSLEGIYDETVDAILYPLLGNASVGSALPDWSYSPDAGTTTFTGKGIVTSYELSMDVSGPVTWSATIQISGAITRA